MNWRSSHGRLSSANENPASFHSREYAVFNDGNGISIHDDLGNGTTNPAELDSNIVKSSGLHGILIATTGHELKKNSSGGSGDQGNGGCELLVAADNFNATGNSANGKIVLPNTDGAAFPTACLE